MMFYLSLRKEISSSVYSVTPFWQRNTLNDMAAGSKQQVKAAVTNQNTE